ncbi:ankyrin repeat protein [Colletotrichum incanum]|uniref:Ankyrin repeat protein n=1 Tax=Colletotrichum incanum TaxID=1573173 RepID=A0A167ACD0_COLIC|nr:ankyrin repeat protein [Colletotrichum incanum]
MADPLGIIGVIGVTGQLTNAVFKLGLDWKDAPQEVRKFMDELESLKTILSETNANIILNQDFKDAFEGRHSTLLSHLRDSTDLATTSLLSSCENNLKDLLKKLQKTASGQRVGWRRAKEAFLSERTYCAVMDLQRRCGMLNRMVSIDSAALGANTNLEIRTMRREWQENMMGENSRSIIEWLNPIDVTAQLSDNLERREAGTGQWLLNSTEFQAWLQTDRQQLFCPGLPGAGETILTSIVIEHLYHRFHNNSAVGIAYIFCNFRRKDEQKLSYLLLGLLRQLCQDRSSLPEEVRQLYNNHKKAGTRDLREETIRILRTVISLYTKTYILVDALDECQNDDDSCRDRFITEISRLSSFCNVNVFATSRDVPDVTNQFNNGAKLKIRASDEDVKRYLDNQMLKLPASSLIGKRSAKAVKSALAKLSTGSDAYDIAYDKAMERIEGQLKDQERLAKDALSWIVCSRAPLSTFELQEALAIERGATELGEENISEIEDINSACAGLVTVDEESHVIRLVHYTTQEYFERTKIRWLPEAEAFVTVSCVNYLSFKDFSSGPCNDYKELRKRLEKQPALPICGTKLGTSCPSNIASNQTNLSASFEVLWNTKLRERGGKPEWYEIRPTNLSGLHLEAHFGIEEYFEIAMKEIPRDLNKPIPKFDISAQDSLGQTPVFYAASSNFEDLTKVLLEHKPVNFNKKKTTMAITRWLIATYIDKINTDPKDKYGQTPLLYAAKHGHEAIFRCLLDTGKVDVNSRNIHGRTPLLYATEMGHNAIARCLLETGKVNVNVRNVFGRTPLSYAAEKGHEAIVECLLETRKIDVNSKDSSGRTPLLYAAHQGHESLLGVYSKHERLTLM